jgi:hypothetical protein
MKKRVNAAVAMAIFAGMVGTAGAARYQGTVSNVTPYNNLVFVAVSGGGFDGPASTCYSSSNGAMFDPSTAVGKAITATMLTAKVTGRLVYVYGDATCPATVNPYDSQHSENMVGVDLKG